MDNALVRFISLAPKDVVELICNYLDFSEFLSLTSVSRYVRSVLVNHHLFWVNYYMKRVNCRQYEEYLPVSDNSSNKYELRMPSFDKKQGISDPANRLLNSARKVEIMKTDIALSSNPMLNLGILDNFKRSRWKGEFKQYTENLSRFSLPNIVVPTLGSNPFLVISNTNVCGFNINEDRFMFNNFVTPLSDNKRYEIKICCWVRFDDVNYMENGSFRSLTSRVNSFPKILVIVYGTDMNSLAISFYYYYDDSGFVNIPALTIKMDMDKDDIVSSMDVYGSLGSWDGRDLSFSSLNLFLGTANGNILQKRIENDFVYVDRKESLTNFEINSLRFVSCNNKSVLVVFSSGNYLGVVDVSNDSWNVIENITDNVVTYSIDTPNCLMAYSTSFQNRTTFVDLYNFSTEKEHYLVPKPPFFIQSLERDSKWAIVIRNYIRVLQVIHPNNTRSSLNSNKMGSEFCFLKDRNDDGLNGIKNEFKTDENNRDIFSTCNNNNNTNTTSIYSNVNTNQSNTTNNNSNTNNNNTRINYHNRSNVINRNNINSISTTNTTHNTISSTGRSRRNDHMRTSRESSIDYQQKPNNNTNNTRNNNRYNTNYYNRNNYCNNDSNNSDNNNEGYNNKRNNNNNTRNNNNNNKNNYKHQKLKFKSVCTLNGHTQEITHCVHDGWSKLVTIDAGHNLFVWDYTVGCKIFSFSLVSNTNKEYTHLPYLNLNDFDTKNKRTNFRHLDSRPGSKPESLDSSQNSCYRKESETYRKDYKDKDRDREYDREDRRYKDNKFNTNNSRNNSNNNRNNNNNKNNYRYNKEYKEREYMEYRDYYSRDLDINYSKKDLDFKRSVNLINRMVTNSEMKNAIQDMLYFDDLDFDKSPLSDRSDRQSQKSNKSKNSVPASNIKGLLDPNKKGQKYHVDVSVQSLIVYYKSCNVMQVWSFK